VVVHGRRGGMLPRIVRHRPSVRQLGRRCGQHAERRECGE